MENCIGTTAKLELPAETYKNTTLHLSNHTLLAWAYNASIVTVPYFVIVSKYL